VSPHRSPKRSIMYLPVRQFDLIADQYNLPRTPVYSMQYIGGVTDAGRIPALRPLAAIPQARSIRQQSRQRLGMRCRSNVGVG
jgi:hypothetical protein